MILMTLVLALQAPVQQPADPVTGAATETAKPKKEKVICKAETRTGSRTNFRQVCHTQAEWALIKREYREKVEKSQRERGWYEK
jgi:TRAP-type uncharacterized transport system substrate-binding protein